MTSNQKRHIRLLKGSQDFKNQGKDLFLENQEEYFKLAKYNTAVAEQIFWQDRYQIQNRIGDGLTYVRGRHGCYLVKNDNGLKDVVGIAYWGSRNDMKTLVKEMNKLYNVNIEPGVY